MPRPESNYSEISDHYGQSELTKNLLELISAAGKSIDNLQPDDLIALDEFHVRGRLATIELAQLAGLDNTKHVLDIGSGIGGPSRFLTLNYGCRVTGIDLTAEYCRLAEFLADKFGLGERLRYHHGSALEMPFADKSFDVIWTQHVAMNIREKEKFYMEAARCLKSNGLFAIYDILGTDNQPIHFPVPWAKRTEMSFLATSAEMKTYLENVGMKIQSWQDKTAAGIEWIRRMREESDKKAPPVLGIHLLLGEDFKLMMGNLFRNLIEKRVELVEITAIKT
jgi:ubiquinone/menaquinone biosynthesis C-methylase UbiE